MAQEKGIVVKTSENNKAWIKTKRSGGCEACSQKGSCGVSESSVSMEIEAENMINAEVGDSVIVNVKTSSLLKLSFLLYVFPIILMIIGAALGNRFRLFQLSNTVSSVLLAMIFFLLSFIIIRIRSASMAKKDEYKPKIIKKCHTA